MILISSVPRPHPPCAETDQISCAGTSTGFGKRLVSIVLARGDYVVATVRKPEDVQAVVSNSKSSRLQVFVLDLRDSPQSIRDQVREVLVRWGRIDVLVNNAGTAPKSLLGEGGSEFYTEQLQMNLVGTLNVTNAVLPSMRERRDGTVIFLGSRSVWKPEVPLTGYYAAWKAATHLALGATYSAELRDFGIRVMVICPGGFRTEKIHAGPLVVDNRIPEYDALRKEALANFDGGWERASGDPTKAMELLVDVVNGEGKAAGKEFPLYLLMGSLSYDAARVSLQKLCRSMELWEDVSRDLDIDPDE
ncbi:uncharacterized protein FIBRA_06824 [Fibroporia radiculosa]|uniref:Uncharacterized protein n=1 Tax=Fibroporia radiculosa TaxID=599839 RepID=J4GTL9_9APHY|nr:uncharacterized protein FIBRA_06824 [Fibroporia radiculosa]CCM04640.1 predicted protein [Fibroporia radiculosa]